MEDPHVSTRTAWNRRASLGALLAIAGTPFASAQAQGTAGFPSRPLRIIVGSSPGGGIDFVARLVGQGITEAAGVPVVIENRPGAGTTIGAAAAARAPADGYTLYLASTSLAMGPGMYKSLPYDTLKDFAPVMLFASAPLVMAVNPNVPAKSASEFVSWVKSRSGPLKFGSAGHGTSPHLAGEVFKHATGIDYIHVAYKGSTPATTDLIAGQVEMLFGGIIEILPHIKSGKVRALAVTTPKRSSLLPDVPSLSESGISMDVSSWYGLVAPAGTPREVIAKLHDIMKQVLASPSVRTRLESQAEAIAEGPEQFGAFLRAETARWTNIIQSAGVQAEGR